MTTPTTPERAMELASLIDAGEASAESANAMRSLAQQVYALKVERDALKVDAILNLDVHQFKARDLIKRFLTNVSHKRGRPFWASVSDATALGSTCSCALAYEFWIDPDTGKPIDALKAAS